MSRMETILKEIRSSIPAGINDSHMHHEHDKTDKVAHNHTKIKENAPTTTIVDTKIDMIEQL